MDPLSLAALIGGVGSMAGAGIGAASGAATNAANAGLSQKQMDFQAYMSNTAYQRSMNDMKQAGLNPMLAFSQGGASAPTGASIAMQNPVQGNPLEGVASSAADLARTNAQIANIESQTEMNKIAQKTETAKAEQAKFSAKAQEATLPTIQRKAEAEKHIPGIGMIDALVDRVLPLLGGISSAQKIIHPPRGTDTETLVDTRSGEVVGQKKRRR